MMENKTLVTIHAIFRGLAAAALFLSVIVLTLVAASRIQLAVYDPVYTPGLENLEEKYRADPKNEELKEEIRYLDLLARKAYFTKTWQIRTGGYILLGTVVTFLASLWIMSLIRKKLPVPGKGTDPEKILTGRSTARWIIGCILGVLTVISLFAIFTTSDVILSPDKNTAAAQEAGTGVKKTLQSFENPFPDGYEKNWPGFRGPYGNGIAAGDIYPIHWNVGSGENILWKAELPGQGFNSPVIWNDRLFLSFGDEKKFEVYCYSTEDGSVLWQQTMKTINDPSTLPEITEDTGYAASSIAAGENMIFVIFTTGDLYALNFDGMVLWTKDFGLQDISYGYASSLTVYGPYLIVQRDLRDGARVMALDIKNGQTVWETERDVSASWASPVLARTGNSTMLLLSANPLFSAYNPETGEELWSLDYMNGEVAPSPVFSGTRAFAANQFATLVAVDLESGEFLWEYYDDLPNVSSPLAAQEWLLLPTNYGVITCLDAATGELLWLEEWDEGFYSSPVFAGGHVYIADLEGLVHIFKPGREYQGVAEIEMGEPVVSTPAFVNEKIYFRTERHLYCIGG